MRASFIVRVFLHVIMGLHWPVLMTKDSSGEVAASEFSPGQFDADASS